MGQLTSDQWAPDHVRRQVIRQARYALSVAVLDEDRVPPEGPFDAALTNGLLAIVAAIEPTDAVDTKGFSLSARALLQKATALGLSIDRATLDEGLDFTQPLRHGRADDEWIQLGSKHLMALRELDEIDGLQVLHHVESHPTVDDMMVTLFYERAQAYAERDVRRTKDLLDVMEPEECDGCWRLTFVPFGYGVSGGMCIACGNRRDEETSEESLTMTWSED